jgi:L-fuconolactonase
VQGPGSADVDDYRRRREASGLQGLRLFSLGEPGAARADQVGTFALLSEFARAGDKLWFYGGPEQMRMLGLVLAELPELTVVLNHLGFWPTTFHSDEHGRPRFESGYTQENLDAVAALARFPRVYVLCTGMYAFASEPCPYDDRREVTSTLLAAYGAGRVLLGTDFPWIRDEPGYRETVAAVDRHLDVLDDMDRAAVRGGNAMELFW